MAALSEKMAALSEERGAYSVTIDIIGLFWQCLSSAAVFCVVEVQYPIFRSDLHFGMRKV